MVVARTGLQGRISDTKVLTLYCPVYSVCRTSVYHLRTISIGSDHVNAPSNFANSTSQPVPDKTLSSESHLPNEFIGGAVHAMHVDDLTAS